MYTRVSAMSISITCPHNSFFVELSRKIDEWICLYVYRNPKSSLYYVIAYVPKPLASDLISEVLKNYQENIIKIYRYMYPQETYLVAIKQRCEFYELVENYNVTIFVPYTIYRGCRIYCVYGDAEDINKYIDNVIARYGRKNVIINKVSPAVCISHQVKNVLKSYILTVLTDKEKQLLVKAFESGYISSRRRISLEELAVSLSIAKPTTSLMLRKAIEKILRRVLM